MHLRTIAITAYRRPHLFAAMLKTLVANSLAGWRILVAIETSSVADEIASVAAKLLGGQDFNCVINMVRLGIKNNPFQLIERAFSDGAESILYIEEDLLVSPDVTRLACWFEANHRPEWLCLGLLAGGCASAGFLSNPDYPDLLFAGHTFNSLGFAVGRAEWERYMRNAWMTEPARVLQFDGALTGGWDWSLFTMLMNNPQLRTLQPVLARATHNGRLEGEHCTPKFHDAAFARLPIFRGAADAPLYRVEALDLLPNVVRSHARLWFEMTCALRALNQRSGVSRRLWFEMTCALRALNQRSGVSRDQPP
jgi:hypothetical protein